MSDAITVLNGINDAVFVSLVNTTLQMTLLIPLIALFIWMFRIKSAPIRYSLWLVVLFAIIALPVLAPFIPQMDFARFHQQRAAGDAPTMRLGMGTGDAGEAPEVSVSAPSTSTVKAAVNVEMDVPLINPVSVAYFIWCAGALFMSCITIGIYKGLRKLRLRSHDVENQTALEMLSRLKDKLGVRGTVGLKTSSEVYTPMSMGTFSPVIIVPDGVMYDGSDDQLEMILTHELAHIRRCDYLVNLLQNMLRAVFFFHPFFHLMKRNLAREREHICDDWVIDVTNRRSKYAGCLVGLLEKAIHKPVNIPVSMAMAERKRDIPGRIDMIVDKTRKTATKISRKGLLALLLIGCLSLPVLGGIGLIRFAGARAEDEGKIVFASNRDGVFGPQGQDLYVMDADGSNVRRLTHGAAASAPCWSPDGKKIAFESYLHAPETVNEIYVIDADGANMKRLTDTPSMWGSRSPSWSPDGKKIIFASDRIRPGKIFVMDADGKNPEVLVDLTPGWNWFRSSWSPDGKRIAFCNNGGPPDNYAIWVMDADGSNKRKVIDLPGWDLDPVWSPDGKRIVFYNNTNNKIYLIDADGGNKQEFDGENPFWSPDGERIVFCSNRDGDYEIYVMDADGKNVERLTDDPAMDAWGHWWGAPIAVEPAGKLRSTWGKIKARSQNH